MQGKLEPAGGIIPIASSPGDRIVEFLVKEGDSVEAGQVVAKLESERLRSLEVRVAQQQLAEAKAQLATEELSGQAQLGLAQLGVRKNEKLLADAKRRLATAESSGGELDLLTAKVQLAKDELARLRKAAVAGPDGRRLVNDTQLRQQELLVQAADAELAAARRDAKTAVEAAEMILEASKQEIVAAEAKAASARAAVFLVSMELKIELLQQQLESARLIAPVAGTILSIDASVGQPTTGMPIMRIADISTMQCRAEVPIEDIAKVKIGSKAMINQGGLGGEGIRGQVSSISQIVGSPSVPSLNPMDPVDYRTIEVRITIDAKDAAQASKLIHSQVEVAIVEEN